MSSTMEKQAPPALQFPARKEDIPTFSCCPMLIHSALRIRPYDILKSTVAGEEVLRVLPAKSKVGDKRSPSRVKPTFTPFNSPFTSPPKYNPDYNATVDDKTCVRFSESEECHSRIAVLDNLNAKEKMTKQKKKGKSAFDIGNEQFCLDCIFDATCTQNDVYETIGNKIAMSAVEPLWNSEQVGSGHCNTILSMGTPKSGKTYTLFGKVDECNAVAEHEKSSDEDGLLHKIIDELFSRMQPSENKFHNGKYGVEEKAMVEISIHEIRDEIVYDLLAEPEESCSYDPAVLYADSSGQINQDEKPSNGVSCHGKHLGLYNRDVNGFEYGLDFTPGWLSQLFSGVPLHFFHCHDQIKEKCIKVK